MSRPRIAFTLLALYGVAQGQNTRESYRAQFEAWQQVEPNLESDAGDPSARFPDQVERSSKLAQAYLDARRTFLNPGASDAQATEWLNRPFPNPPDLLAAQPEVQQLLSATIQQLTATITSFAAIKDPALQQVRQAMERERVALTALSGSLNARDILLQTSRTATQTTNELRATALQGLQAAEAANAELAQRIGRESEAWSKYYGALIEGAVSVAPAPAAGPTSYAPTAAAPNPAAPKVPTPKPSPAGLPLARYVGEWDYPAKGLFFGPEPESVSLIVNEEAGTLSGSLAVRFVTPPGGGAPAEMRLEFRGLIQQTRPQVFPLRTSDGYSGTIELIPGAAFNLLEINVQTDAPDPRVRAANFVLLKH